MGIEPLLWELCGKLSEDGVDDEVGDDENKRVDGSRERQGWAVGLCVGLVSAARGGHRDAVGRLVVVGCRWRCR